MVVGAGVGVEFREWGYLRICSCVCSCVCVCVCVCVCEHNIIILPNTNVPRRFANKQGSRRVIAELCRRIAPTGKEIVFFGAATLGGTNSAVPGLSSSRVALLVQALRRRLGERLVLTNEFRSSIMDCDWHVEMHDMERVVGWSKRVHHVRRQTISGESVSECQCLFGM